MVQPDRDVRPFQDVLIDLGARLAAGLRPPGRRAPAIRAAIPTIWSTMSASPASGRWRAGAVRGEEQGRGAPNDGQLEAYVANGCFWRFELAPEESLPEAGQPGLPGPSAALGLLDKAAPITLHLYAETLQRFRLARGGRAVQPPGAMRERVRTYFDPLPFWYEPFEHVAWRTEFPLHAVTQRPMPMYHSWGSQNAWLRQILARNRLYMNRRTAAELGLQDGDWVWITSPHGR